MQETPAILVLENGSVYRGTAFGHVGEAAGEVVFNTSMTGYQEILTDPSYAGQMVVMTYPLIGNYGITPGDNESSGIRASALIVREASNVYSNFESTRSLDDTLKEAGVMGLAGIDTRKLVREIRQMGAFDLDRRPRCAESAGARHPRNDRPRPGQHGHDRCELHRR